MSTAQTPALDWQPRPRLIFGAGAVGRVGELATGLGMKRVVVVTDPGIVKAGHEARVAGLLREAGIEVTVFDQVQENPTTRDVDACASVAREAKVDGFVGLGGGSAMDTAKGCNFLLTNGGEMKDYWGVGKATKAMLPLIAIPTTAGTGSECQSFALIVDEQTHQKMACGDAKAIPRIAILDPMLTLTQPRSVAACTGVDAMTHAVESAVCKARNDLSVMFSRTAFGFLAEALPRVLETPDDLPARGRMQLGAAFAGVAIENSMLGAAHSAANPLTARLNVVHGLAVGVMLPVVMRFNIHEKSALAGYADLARAAGLCAAGESDERAAASLITRVEALLNLSGVPRSLADVGVTPRGIPALAKEAATQWTAGFNPRVVGVEEFEGLYEEAMRERG